MRGSLGLTRCGGPWRDGRAQLRVRTLSGRTGITWIRVYEIRLCGSQADPGIGRRGVGPHVLKRVFVRSKKAAPGRFPRDSPSYTFFSM